MLEAERGRNWGCATTDSETLHSQQFQEVQISFDLHSSMRVIVYIIHPHTFISILKNFSGEQDNDWISLLHCCSCLGLHIGDLFQNDLTSTLLWIFKWTHAHCQIETEETEQVFYDSRQKRLFKSRPDFRRQASPILWWILAVWNCLCRLASEVFDLLRSFLSEVVLSFISVKFHCRCTCNGSIRHFLTL